MEANPMVCDGILTSLCMCITEESPYSASFSTDTVHGSAQAVYLYPVDVYLVYSKYQHYKPFYINKLAHITPKQGNRQRTLAFLKHPHKPHLCASIKVIAK